MASIDAFKVRAVIEAGYDKNSLRRANNEIGQSFNQMKGRMAKLSAVTTAATTNFMMVGATIAASFGAGVAAAASFEEQFVRVKKTLDIAGDSKQVERALENISKKLRDLTKLSPVTTDTVTEIAAIGGQLGVAAKDIVEFTDTIQKLTIATNLSAENAAMAMSRLQEITGTTTKELDNLGSSLVALGNNFAAQESEIVTAALQIATSTSQIQGEMNNAAVDALAFSTALKAIGQPSQAGATAIVRLMTEISEAVATGGANLRLFAQVARMSVPAFEELFRLDSSQAVAAFIKGLEDTSSLGQTNIAVLQKLGLGQVRTQKAILALSKANETLYDALNTANSAYTENIALTEEAERRYDTLFSELQRGRNLMKAEFIDFGLENLDGAKNIVKSLNDFLYAATSGAVALVKNLAPVSLILASTLSLFRGVKVSLKASTDQSNIFASSLDRARASAVGLQQTLGSNVGMMAFDDDMLINRLSTPTKGIRGQIGLPMNTLRPTLSERLIPGNYKNRIYETLSTKGMPELIYGGKLPESLRGKFNPEVVDPYSRFNFAGARIGSRVNIDPTRPGQIKSRLFKAQANTIDRLRLATKKLTLNEQGYAEAQKIIRKEIGLRNKAQQDLNRFIDTTRKKGMGAKGVINEQLRGMGIDGSNAQMRRFRKDALRGNIKQFNLLTESINKKIDATGTATASELQFLEAVDKGRAGLDRFRNAIFGTIRAFAKLAGYMIAIQAIFSIVQKYGEAKRGIDEFAQSLKEATEGVRELYTESVKLSQLTAPGGVLSEIRDAAVLEGAEKTVEERRAALNKAREELATELGTSYVNNIMTSGVGAFIAGEGKQGSLIERFINFEALAFEKSENEIRERIGSAIGNVLLQAVDPDYLKDQATGLPSVADVLNSLLFSEKTFAKGSFQMDDIYLPSKIFTDASSGILLALQESKNKPLTADEIMALTGIDSINDPSVVMDITSSLGRFINKFSSSEDLIKKITNHGLIDAVAPGVDNREIEYIRQIYNNISDELEKTYGTVAIPFTDEDVAGFAIDLAKTLSAAEGLVGTSIGNIRDSYGKVLNENSPLGKEIKKFLKNQLEDFKDTGIISAEEVARTGNNYEKIVALYSSVYEKFNKELEMSNEELSKEFQITEGAALQLAARLQQTFTEARKSLVALTAPLPEDAFEDMTALDLLIQSVQKNAKQAQFEKTLDTLVTLNKPVLANELAKVGVGALPMAQQYLENPSIAAAQEMYLRSIGGEEYTKEIVPEEEAEAQSKRMEEMGFKIGDGTVGGVIAGIESRSAELTDIFTSVIHEAIFAALKEFSIFSPSLYTQKRVGGPLIDGVRVGIANGKVSLKNTFLNAVKQSIPKQVDLPDLTGTYRGTNISYEGLVNTISSNSAFATNEFAAKGFLKSLGAEMSENLNMFAEKLAKSYQEANSRLQEAFNLITAITNAERDQVNQARNLVSAKQDYAAELRRQATLEERITKARETVQKLEISGMKGNIDMNERIGLLQREIDLTERKRRLDKDFSAREQLDIQAKEREVADLGRMFNLGIVSALDLEAAQDELREMKGEFKTNAEKELFLLEYAAAAEEKAEYEKEILEIHPDLVQARENYVALLNEQELIQFDVQNGANGIAAAEERVAAGVLAVDAAYTNFKLQAPEYAKEIELLDGAFGGVNTRVKELSDLITTITTPGMFDFSSLTTPITEAAEQLRDFLFTKEMDKMISEGGTADFYNFLNTIYNASVKGSAYEGKSFSELMRFGQAGLEPYTALTGVYSALGGRDGSEVQDLSNIDKYSEYFLDASNKKKFFSASGNRLNTGDYAGSILELINMIGVGTIRRDTGEIAFSVSNAEAISAGLAKELMVMGFQGLEDNVYMQLINAQKETIAANKKKPITEDFSFMGDDDNLDPIGNGTLGRNSVVDPNVVSKGLTSWLNELISSGGVKTYYGSGYVPGGMMGMRTKGFKMGGRVPDMTNVKPKKYAMGGRDHMMRRALVGEYGPEEVRFVPGSGFLVKPLTQGGRGNNTIVEHLSVNVTGVPSDPSQARKAAIEIRKALSRLDREGSVGSSIRRT